MAVLTGHVLKDPDYVSDYHRGTLSLGSDTGGTGTAQTISGAFRNTPKRVAANKSAILDLLRPRT